MNKNLVYVALQQFCEEDEAPRRILSEAGCEIRQNLLGRRLRKEEMPQLLAGADAVLAGVEPYDAALFKALPRLRCISRCGAGTDAVDLDAARLHGITVCTTPDETVEPVAQMTMAMIFALARNFPLHLADFRDGNWKKRTGFLLSEWTIGLVGFGRIGKTVARYLQPFGPRLLVCDPVLREGDPSIPAGIELRPLESLLAESDLVSLHADRRPDQGALIGPKQFERMKQGSRLVNTSRGYLLDEGALGVALESGRLSGAALDVFETEPYTGLLTGLPNVLCTPHVATLTRASRAAMERRCAQNVVDFFAWVPR